MAELNYMKKTLVQFDLLKPGKTYQLIVDKGLRKESPEQMKLLGCYPDYYLFMDSAGRKTSLLKADLYGGSWEVKGLNPKAELLKAAGKLKESMQETIKAEKKKADKSDIQEEVERIVSENTDKMVTKVIDWLKKNPNQPGDVSRILIEHNPSQYYIDKVRNTVAEKLEKEGCEIKITNTRPKYIILRDETKGDPVKEEAATMEPINEQDIDTTKPIMEEERSTPNFNEYGKLAQDRRFLNEKLEELELRVVDEQERFERITAEYKAKMEIYQEFIDDIRGHFQG